MKPRIYEMEHSPYCIPITQAMTALGISFERIDVPNWDRSEIIELTDGAYYQVPILVNGDDVVFESSDKSLDVANYVDRVYGNGRLFPSETRGLQEIVVEHIENELEGLTFKLVDIRYIPSISDPVGRAMTQRHKERRFGRGCLDRWRDNRQEMRNEVDRLLGRFESTLERRPYIMGDQPQYVDFALFGVIGNYTYRDYNQLSEKHGSLKAWLERLRAFRYS